MCPVAMVSLPVSPPSPTSVTCVSPPVSPRAPQATTPFVRSVFWTIWAIVASSFVVPVILTFYVSFLRGVGVLAGSGSGFVVGSLVWFVGAALKDEGGGVAAFAENCVNDAVVIKARKNSSVDEALLRDYCVWQRGTAEYSLAKHHGVAWKTMSYLGGSKEGRKKE